MQIYFPFESIKSFTFKREPTPLPAELRPLHKIGLILLFLKLNCRASTSSILKIQFLNWVLKTENMKIWLINETKGRKSTYFLKVVHLDPAVNRAVHFALADNLISLEKSGKIKLADLGIKIVNEILGNIELFSDEKEYLEQLGKAVPEMQVENILFG